MTLLCAALVALAVSLLVRPPAARGLSRLRTAEGGSAADACAQAVRSGARRCSPA